MRERSRATVTELRGAIRCLPRETRIAMLQGISANEIVVGAYTHGGGICPMLAAHRAGGRTSFISFARAWDRFAYRGDPRREGARRARRATERELLILRTHLEATLLEDEAPVGDLAAAVAEHRQLQRQSERAEGPRRPPRRRPDTARPGDPDRSRELESRPGWRWMRAVRRLDDYGRALEHLAREQPMAQADAGAPGAEREASLV